jgi:V/A-type H+-transporting ATPase subunit K
MTKYLVALFVFALASLGFAQEAAAASEGAGIAAGLLGVGAGLAVGLGAIGTGLAQGRIGAAAAGVTAENPGRLGLMLLWFAIPETLVIFGFVISFLLIGQIG